MAKASPILNALNAGEWSPLLDGRTDIVGYGASAYRCENFIPTVQGPVLRRGGSAHVMQAKASGRTWLMPFIKSRNDAYQIEFGNLYCRFYTNRSPVLTGSAVTITGATVANPVVITAAAHGYANGQDVFISGVGGMTQLNGRWFKVANQAANTFELQSIHGANVNGTAYTAYTSGGAVDKPYEIVSPYSTAALVSSAGEFNLDFVQTGDVIYITDRAGVLAPRSLSRSAATSWAFATIDPDDGPFLAINGTATTIYAGAATGSVTLTASSSIFTANDIGSIIRIDQDVLTSTQPWKTATVYAAGAYVRSEGKEYFTTAGGTSGTTIPDHISGTVSDGGINWTYISAGYGIARITAQAGTTATATVLTTFPQTLVGSGNASVLWRKGAWSLAEGYPTSVAFFRERLALAQNQRIDMSTAANFESFAVDSFGEILAESAVSIEVLSDNANDIVGLSDGRVLSVLTNGGEFIVESPSTSAPFGPNNVRVSRQTAFGARPIRPLRIGDSVLMVQGSGRRVRSLQYSFDVDSFIAPDMTVRAEHIVRPSVTQMARQESPHQTIWFVRADGVLLSFAFDQTQEVRAWARHTMGGTDAVVKAVSVIPSPDAEQDDVWLVVERTINGATRQYIEHLRPEYLTGDARAEVAYADSGLMYSGAAADELHGFDHLEGETVGVLIDGAATPDLIVSAGVVTIPYNGETVQVGLRYSSVYATNRLDGGAGDGTAQGKTKRITDCAFRMLESLGGQAGPNASSLDDIPDLTFRAPSVAMNNPAGLFSGDALLPWPSGYETDARLWYVNDTMFPATIIAIMPQVSVQEAR